MGEYVLALRSSSRLGRFLLGPLSLDGSAAPLSVTTASLPTGTVGAPYSQALAAAVGHGPYVWLAGGLPPGLTLGSNGALAGTPTAAADYSVSVIVIDDSAPLQIEEQALQLSIR